MFEKANGKGEDKGTKRTDKDPNGHKKFYSTLANVFKATLNQKETTYDHSTSTDNDDNKIRRTDPAQNASEPLSRTALSRSDSTSTTSSSHSEPTTGEILAEPTNDPLRDNAPQPSMVITLINRGRDENDRVFIAGGPIGLGSSTPARRPSTPIQNDSIKLASSSNETLVNPPQDQPSQVPYQAATVISLASPGRNQTVNIVNSGRPSTTRTPNSRSSQPHPSQGQHRTYFNSGHDQSHFTGTNVYSSSTYNVRHVDGTTVYSRSTHTTSHFTGTTSGRNVQQGMFVSSTSGHSGQQGQSVFIGTRTSGGNVQQGMFVNSTSSRSGQQGRQSVFMGTRTSGGNIQQGIFVNPQGNDSDDSDED